MEKSWKTRVTGVVVHKATNMLLLMHNSEPKLDFWEFPAGTMEFGETPEETAAREVREEAGMNVRDRGLFDVASCNYRHENREVQELVIAYLFETDDAVVDMSMNPDREHDEWKWVTIEELNAVPNLAATVKCIMGKVNAMFVKGK
jgi:8-oxo-dGTP pyrophosphatase MutT (NUDIX family)